MLAVDGGWNEIRPHKQRIFSAEKFQLNHYISKSQEEWNFRLERGGMEGIDLSKRKQKMFDTIESDPIKDTAILRFLPGLKARLRTE